MSVGASASRPPERQRLLDLALDDQKSCWNRGERVLVEDYLAREPALRDDTEGVLDLIYSECVLRRGRGEPFDANEYIARFPDLAGAIVLQLGVDAAMSTTFRLPAEPSPAGEAIAAPGGLIGDHEILGLLGRGGMGVVYKARDTKLGRIVAIKTIAAGQFATSDHRDRFRDEATAVARLRHPNIIAIHAIGEHEDRPYLSLEFAEGGTLAGRLAGNPMPPREAAELVRTLAQAVHAAHQAGIVHRDLKPGNVLLTGDGVPKVGDFGLARLLGSDSGRTLSGQVVGTPSYMAPEQAEDSKQAGPAADIYALGAILYHALTGRPPFLGESPLETMRMVISTEAVAPRRLRPDVPLDLETICLKCLEKEPSRRYPDAQALAEDLGRYLEGRPIAARPVGPLGQAWRWGRRNRLAAGLSAAVLLVLVAATAVSSILAVRAIRAEGATREQRNRAERAGDRAYKAISSIVLTDRDAMTSEEMQPYREALIDTGLRLASELESESSTDLMGGLARAEALIARAKLLVEKKEKVQARKVGLEAIAILEKLVDSDRANANHRDNLAQLLHQLQLTATDPDTGRSDSRRSNELYAALLKENPDSERAGIWIHNMAINHYNIGHWYYEEKWALRSPERVELLRNAIAAFREGERLSEDVLRKGAVADTVPFLTSLANNQKYLCRAYRSMATQVDDPAERRSYIRKAVESGEQAIAHIQLVADRNPDDFTIGWELQTSQRELGELFRDPTQGNDPESAIPHYQAARKTLKAMAARHAKLISRVAKIQADLAVIDYNLSLAYDAADLVRYFQGPRREIAAEAYEICDKLSLVQSPSADLRRIGAHMGLGMVDYQILDGGRPDPAMIARSEQLWSGLHREKPQDVEAAAMLVITRRVLADALEDRGEAAEVPTWRRRSLEPARGNPALLYVVATAYYAFNIPFIERIPGRLDAGERERWRRRLIAHAVTLLRLVVDGGFRDLRGLCRDPRLDPLRADADFQALVAHVADLGFPAEVFCPR